MKTQAQDLFTRALELPESEREAFLAEQCGENAELHLQVQRMLLEAARADSFFGDTEGATLGAEEFKDSYAEKEGDVIGPYKLRQPIGEGGFGMVWMAEQSEPISRMVALKVIKAGMDTKQVLARFEAERQALAMMDHPRPQRAGTPQTKRKTSAMAQMTLGCSPISPASPLLRKGTSESPEAPPRPTAPVPELQLWITPKINNFA